MSVAQDFDPVDARHLDVGNDHVEERAVDFALGQLAAGDGFDFVAIAAQGNVEQFADGAFVVDDENVTHASLLRLPLPPPARVRTAPDAEEVPSAAACSSTTQTDHEAGALADFGTRPHLALMRLHDLVHDGEAESGSAFKVRLEGLEDFFRLLRLDAGTGVGRSSSPSPGRARRGRRSEFHL